MSPSCESLPSDPQVRRSSIASQPEAMMPFDSPAGDLRPPSRAHSDARSAAISSMFVSMRRLIPERSTLHIARCALRRCQASPESNDSVTVEVVEGDGPPGGSENDRLPRTLYEGTLPCRPVDVDGA